MRFVVLYRGTDFEKYELAAAKAAGFVCTNTRMAIEPGDLVIPRYSCLPYYEELERDISLAGGTLLNSYRQHRFVANMRTWYEILGPELTPETWFDPRDIPFDEDGPFFVKGETNSKKFLFDTHAYAANRSDLGRVFGRLFDDTLIGEQPLCVRRYVPLVTYGTAVHGLPITQEYRFFCAYGRVLSGGYYWSSHVEDLEELGVDKSEVIDCDCVPKSFLAEVLNRIRSYVSGVVIDVGIRTNGSPVVIELNDLQMSGLSENDPGILYPALMSAIVG